jgi:DegV family protein with EDD domain
MMSPRIRILTDSTSDVPPELARQLNITVVPAYVQIEGQSLRDGEQITREEFYRRLPSLSKVPTTAVPSAYEFAAAFRSLVGQADEVIAILLAGALSSMISVAELGAREVPELKVHFVDSQQLAMGIGWQVIMAAEAAARGASAAEIIAMLEDVRPRIRLLAVLDTVKYLVHSGRVSWAKGFAARLLDIKPLIEFRQGEAILVGQVRTRRRAMEQLLEMFDQTGPSGAAGGHPLLRARLGSLPRPCPGPLSGYGGPRQRNRTRHRHPHRPRRAGGGGDSGSLRESVCPHPLRR